MKFLMLSVIGRRTVVAVAAALALGAVLSACGSSGSATSTSGSSATSTSGGTSGAQAQARLNLAKCFRAHGINVPDPSSGGGPAGGGGLFRVLRNYSQAQVTSARQACQKYLAAAFPRLNLSPQQRAQLQQQLVKFAECMRSHGVNIPDPTFNGGGAAGGGFGFGQAFRSGQSNSPAFQTALKACQSLRPRFGRGGAGGSGGGASGAPASGTAGA